MLKKTRPPKVSKALDTQDACRNKRTNANKRKRYANKENE